MKLPLVKIRRISEFEYSFFDSDPAAYRIVAAGLTFLDNSAFPRPRRITKYDKRRMTFPLGMLCTLEDYLKENGVEYEVTDYERGLPDGFVIDDRLGGRYDHQREAVIAFFKRRHGIITVPTRGGKTFIASEIARIFLSTSPGNFLFLTDNVTLFEQAKSDFSKFFERYGGIEIGEIKAGSIDTSHRLTVGTVQTLQAALSGRGGREKKRAVEKYLGALSFLCVDEIHDNCSDARLKIYRRCRSRAFTLCLSATPYRAGAFAQNLKLKAWSGDVVYEISEKTLRERGVLSDYRVAMLYVNHNVSEHIPEVVDWETVRRTMIFDNEFRNGILVRVVDMLRKEGLKTLLLFTSVEHGKRFEAMTGIPFIDGDSGGTERETRKAEFLKGRGGFLSASNIFKKGVTLPEVEVLINVDGGLEDANTTQRKGRVLGATNDKKRSAVIDFFDHYDAYLSKHSERRLDNYTGAIGERRVTVFDTGIDDWLEDLEQWIKNWFGGAKNCSVTP